MRYPIQYIAVHRDKCTRSFGVAPCSALGEKCFNTIGTCKDLTAYDRGVQVDYFINPDNTDASIYAQLGDSVYPFLSDIKHKPATINPASAQTGSTALGTRATVSISLRDGDSDDRYQDEYFLARSGNPNALGTFFGKYFARNKYLWGRRIDWVNAYIENGLIVDAKTRTYVITEVGGPDSSGNVSMTAQDVLVLTSAKKAKFPAESDVRLFADINSTATSLALLASPSSINELSDIIAAWPASGHVRIDDELMAYTKSGLSLNVSRGELGSDADEHKADTTVQLVESVVNKKPWEIVQRILTFGTTIPTELFDVTQWQAESAGKPWMDQNYTAYISEPTGVNELLADISQQMMFFPYFDEETNRILISATTSNLGNVPTVKTLDDNQNLVASSFTMRRNDDAVMTRVYAHTGVRNWAEDLKDRKNYRAVIALITGEEGDDRRRHASSADLFNYWLSDEQSDRVGRMVLSQFAEAGTEFTFKLDAKDTDIKLAQFIEIQHRLLTDAYGRPIGKPAQITRAAESIAGTTWDYKAVNYPLYPMPDFEGNYFILIPISVQNVNLRALFDASRQSVKLKSGDTVTFVVGSGVTIGATSTSNLAIQTGTWPAGVEVILDCTAGGIYIDGAAGAGGAGGDGAVAPSTGAGKPGAAGGNALAVTHPMLINGAPLIRGGGGGGGGGGGLHWLFIGTSTDVEVSIGGGGGGGGQGFSTVSGGAGGVDTAIAINNGAAGENGTRSKAGEGGLAGALVYQQTNVGDGGKGGAWGQPGVNGDDARDDGFVGAGGELTIHPGGQGGQAGAAVAQGNNLLTAPNAIFYGARNN